MGIWQSIQLNKLKLQQNLQAELLIMQFFLPNLENKKRCIFAHSILAKLAIWEEPIKSLDYNLR